MTEMATAKYPDGSTPDVQDVALLAANLFAGGQETTVRLLSFALRIIAERPDLQAFLREDRERIPASSRRRCATRARCAASSAWRDGARPSPGSTSPPAAPCCCCREPPTVTRARFPNPNTFDPERQDARNHLTFGHGIHHCAGAHLARAEGRVAINRLLDLTADIRIAEDAHGPAGDRHYDYLPTFFLRGLTSLTVEVERA